MTPEVAQWRKSSRSGQHTDCVEVGRISDGAAVRDSKNRAGGHFNATRTQWQAFITAIKLDRF